MVDTEQRLRLIHTIREENLLNREQLNKREQILDGDIEPLQKTKGISGFRIRFILAAILFLSFFYMDRTGETLGDIDCTAIVTYLDENSISTILSNLFDFKEDIPYTLSDAVQNRHKNEVYNEQTGFKR